MRLLLTVAILLLTTLAMIAADVAGTWKGTMETQMGATEITVKIPSGITLTGTVNAGEYEGAIQNGKLAGDRISFETNIGPGKLTFEGTVGGDDMKLDVTGTQGDKYKLICKRQK